MGMIERHGKLELRTIPTASRKIIVPIVENRVRKDSTLMTDEARFYKSLDKEYHREVVKHSEDEWARGDANTNSIENAWSLFKRSIVGSFHHISTKHVEAYLDEFEWRFNERKNPHLYRDTMIRLLSTKQMEFKELIDKTA
jgi:transposase-like protein